MKIVAPKFDLIEEFALKFAMTWYDAARSSGLKSKHKTARLWALNNFQKFIPQATATAIEMLGRSDIAANMKETVYLSLMERVNDPELQALHKIETLPDIDIKKLLDNTPLPPIKIENKPVIANDVIKKKNVRKLLKSSIINV